MLTPHFTPAFPPCTISPSNLMTDDASYYNFTVLEMTDHDSQDLESPYDLSGWPQLHTAHAPAHDSTP